LAALKHTSFARYRLHRRRRVAHPRTSTADRVREPSGSPAPRVSGPPTARGPSPRCY